MKKILFLQCSECKTTQSEKTDNINMFLKKLSQTGCKYCNEKVCLNCHKLKNCTENKPCIYQQIKTGTIYLLNIGECKELETISNMVNENLIKFVSFSE